MSAITTTTSTAPTAPRADDTAKGQAPGIHVRRISPRPARILRSGVGDPFGHDPNERARSCSRTNGGAQGLVADGHQCRDLEVFPRPPGTPERERTVRASSSAALVAGHGWGGRTATCRRGRRARFSDELTPYPGAPERPSNSPVWFNCGIEDTAPVLGLLSSWSVDDTMESIPTGTARKGDLQRRLRARASTWRVSARPRTARRRRTASGPVSFMRAATPPRESSSPAADPARARW